MIYAHALDRNIQNVQFFYNLDSGLEKIHANTHARAKGVGGLTIDPEIRELLLFRVVWIDSPAKFSTQGVSGICRAQ